jgi:hypothetical protein
VKPIHRFGLAALIVALAVPNTAQANPALDRCLDGTVNSYYACIAYGAPQQACLDDFTWTVNACMHQYGT